MRFGLFGGARTSMGEQPSDSQQIYEFIDYVTEAEALGFESVFLVEHHFTGFGQVSASLNLLSYLAARTTRMRLGTAVTVLPWHNPALLAEQAATVDVLSGGRLDLGVGRGYRYGEFHGFCMRMEEAEARYQECLAFIRKAWTTPGRFSHYGTYWHYEDVVIEPAPLQRPHPPLWIGANSAASIVKTAHDGMNLLIAQHGTPAQVGEKIAIYRGAVEARGRRFDPFSIGVTRALHVAHTAAERDRQHDLRIRFLRNVQELSVPPSGPAAGGFYQGHGDAADMRRQTETDALIGTPDEIVHRLKEYEAAGVRHMLLIDVGGSRDALRIFGREVMPEFRA
ncbi:MAG TPA: LLM class flavin-dependent oxidoreductase [Acetobacteraceae bacterium]|nr:LLM class flavin-dependent oxidoreductase [Acetobacteraceae bacterium]